MYMFCSGQISGNFHKFWRLSETFILPASKTWNKTRLSPNDEILKIALHHVIIKCNANTIQIYTGEVTFVLSEVYKV